MNNPNLLDLLKRRGLIDQVSSEALAKAIEEPITLYGGFDPTAESLHLGNLQAIILLAWFKRYGHKVVALMGGATGMIGDPSGKSRERVLLTEEVLKKNLGGIENNLRTILGAGENLLFVNNLDWFRNFSLIQFLREVGKYFRMGVMLSKEGVKTRLASEEGLSFTEFTYQILQGYDFLYLFEKEKAVLQVGGSDQWGNITAGIDLIRRAKGEEVYGLTMPLLLKADGTKFGKSESGAIWLSSEMLSPYEFYQHLMRVRDDEVMTLLKRLTFVDIEEIEAMEKEMSEGKLAPGTAQERLAKEVTLLVHGEEGLQKALLITSMAKPGHKSVLSAAFFIAFAQEVPPFKSTKNEVIGQKLIDLMVKFQMVASKGDARRLIRNGGVSLNEIKVDATNEDKLLEEDDLFEGSWLLISLGKKNKFLLSIENRVA